MKIYFLSLLFLAGLAAAGQPATTHPGQPATRSADTAWKDTTQLGSVIVRGAKPIYQQRSDGLVINVGGSILSKGSSVLEILERSPGVIIDHRNNSILLNGKSGVMVMLNGKLMRMPLEQVITLLNSLSANDIEKIELLTTPPAKYDAEGSAGLINIVLKKDKGPGTNGTLSLTGGYGWGEKGTGSLHLDHNTGMFDYYGAYSYTHDRSYQSIFGQGSSFTPVLGGATDFTYLGIRKPLSNNHNASIGAEVRLNPTLTIGGSINYNDSRESNSNFNQTDYNVLPDSLLLYKGAINGTNRWRNIIPSFYTEKTLGTDEKIDADLGYLYYNNSSPTDVQSSFLDSKGNTAGTNNDSLFAPHQEGFANTTIQVGVAQAGYSKRLGKKITLETGIKATYTESSSRSGIESQVNGTWVASLETSNYIRMKECIDALYASVNTQLNPSTTLVLGARYEYSRTRMSNGNTGAATIDRKLGKLFPNLSLSGKFNDRSDWQMSYTERISRPSYNDLASYVAYNDAVSVFTGNPSLQPTITRNLKLGANARNYSFSVLLSRDDNPIAQGQLVYSPSGDIVYITPQNVSWQKNLTFQANAPCKMNGWWTMSYGFVGGWRQFRIDYTPQPVEKTYFGYSLNFTGSFRLPRQYSAELSGWYNSLSYYGSAKVEGYGTVNAGIKKELLRNKGSFQLSATDLFRSMHVISYIGAVTEEAFATKARIDWRAESRKFPVLKLTYTRSFGSGAGGNRQNRGLEGERDRITPADTY
jgi:iron complex outermembrane receptor protein